MTQALISTPRFSSCSLKHFCQFYSFFACCSCWDSQLPFLTHKIREHTGMWEMVHSTLFAVRSKCAPFIIILYAFTKKRPKTNEFTEYFGEKNLKQPKNVTEIGRIFFIRLAFVYVLMGHVLNQYQVNQKFKWRSQMNAFVALNFVTILLAIICKYNINAISKLKYIHHACASFIENQFYSLH